MAERSVSNCTIDSRRLLGVEVGDIRLKNKGEKGSLIDCGDTWYSIKSQHFQNFPLLLGCISSISPEMGTFLKSFVLLTGNRSCFQ